MGVLSTLIEAFAALFGTIADKGKDALETSKDTLDDILEKTKWNFDHLNKPEQELNGTVKWDTLEGGFWKIESTEQNSEGTGPLKVFEPLNMPAAFQTDGLAITARYKDAPSMASVHGKPMAYLTFIKKV